MNQMQTPNRIEWSVPAESKSAITDNWGNTVAHIYGLNPHSTALLMAAAKDLYEALKDMIEGNGEPHERVIKAKDALNKANGK